MSNHIRILARRKADTGELAQWSDLLTDRLDLYALAAIVGRVRGAIPLACAAAGPCRCDSCTLDRITARVEGR